MFSIMLRKIIELLLNLNILMFLMVLMIQLIVFHIILSSSRQVLERWEFKIENEKTEEGKLVDEAVKDEKKIRSEIRDVIRQITASVTFLPLLDCLCSFDILIYTHR